MFNYNLSNNHFSDITKYKIYKSAWPNLKKRTKYTGYERYADQDHFYRSKLIEKYGMFDDRVLIPIQDFFKTSNLYPKVISKEADYRFEYS